MAETLLQPPLPLTGPQRIGEGEGEKMEVPRGALVVLVVLVGPQGCGKGSFARRWFRETEVVSSDECRRWVPDDAASQEVSREAFAVFYTLVRARLTHGRTTVADATNLTPWSRQKVRRIAVARGRPLVAIAFDAPLETCLARQSRRERGCRRTWCGRATRPFARPWPASRTKATSASTPCSPTRRIAHPP